MNFNFEPPIDDSYLREDVDFPDDDEDIEDDEEFVPCEKPDCLECMLNGNFTQK